MKFKLKIKFLIFSIGLTICFLASIFYSLVTANQEFDKYVKQKEIEQLASLSDTLAFFYSERGGWKPLIQARDLWTSLLKDGFEKVSQGGLSQEKNGYPIDGTNPAVMVIYTYNDVPTWDQFNLGARVCLFDKEKKYIIGPENYAIEEFDLLPIKLENQTIGWLGLLNHKRFEHPLDQRFRKAQSTIFYKMGGVLLSFILIMDIIFLKNILRPITHLTSATNALRHRNFTIRIPVETSDEIGELAEKFNDMAYNLERYEQNQEQWMMDISHELRTPLSMLTCEIEGLKDGIRKPNQELFESLSNEMEYLKKLVNDIHQISLIETGNFPAKKKIIKPIPILIQNAHIFEESFKSNQMLIELKLEETAVDLEIIGDPDRLKQLFSNIFENSIRHMNKPGKFIIRQTHDAEYINFEFEDSGPGIPDEALTLIFNRLYRVDLSRSRETGGSGLGLAICKSIVEMHDGKIQALNVQGGGFVIEILLPLVNRPLN